MDRDISEQERQEWVTIATIWLLGVVVILVGPMIGDLFCGAWHF